MVLLDPKPNYRAYVDVSLGGRTVVIPGAVETVARRQRSATLRERKDQNIKLLKESWLIDWRWFDYAKGRYYGMHPVNGLVVAKLRPVWRGVEITGLLVEIINKETGKIDSMAWEIEKPRTPEQARHHFEQSFCLVCREVESYIEIYRCRG